MAVVWDRTPGPAPVARTIAGVVLDTGLVAVLSFTARDLDVEGRGPACYVRDPAITHSRIAGRYVLAWRESLNPAACDGQTIMARELDEITGLVAPPITIASQGVAGVLPNEFGPPLLEGGSRNNGRVFAGWVADTLTKGQLDVFGQGLDTDAATGAPPAFVPVELSLGLAPNPFNPRTSIVLSLPTAGRARIEIYDLRGRLVRQLVDEELPAGEYTRSWSGLDDQGRRVGSGVYLVRLRHPGGERVAKAALEWVHGNVRHAGLTSQDLGALWALRNRKGDCTEMSYLFVALCRARGMPARVIGGYPCDRNMKLQASTYHNWAEFFDGTTWQLVDPQFGRFMEDEDQYLAMRIFTTNTTIATFHQVQVEGDGVEVRMSR